MKDLKKILGWVIVILWMAMIFCLSHQPAVESDDLSIDMGEIIIGTAESFGINELDIGIVNHLVRKNAHFFIYLVLGVLVINALKSIKLIDYEYIIFSIVICILYAVTDEAHQIFIPGRSGQIRDVLIDSIGALVGILFYFKGGFLHNERN